MAILEQYHRLMVALAAVRERINQQMLKALPVRGTIRPHAHMQITAGKLTHTSQDAAAGMLALLTRKFRAMRTTTIRMINAEVNKAYGAGELAKMDVATLADFKKATAGKIRYSVNHVFDHPLQLRPRLKRPYGKKSEVYDVELKLADLTPTQYWLKPNVVIEYAEQGENETTGQTDERTVHVVHLKNDWLLSDGHHRATARRLCGEKKIAATIFPRWATEEEINGVSKRDRRQLWATGRVEKADDYSDITDEIMKALQDDFQDLPADSEAFLQQAALSGLSQGVIAIDVSDTGLLSDINTSAKEWAADRAAEMVGMRYDEDGNLEENPNPRWTITSTTRDKIQDVVEQAFEESSSMSDISAAIDEAGIFDAARADMIARTEVSRAQLMGNLELWMQSGAVTQYDWLAGDDACPLCLDLADGGPYEIDSGPVPIDDSHPNCNCVLSAVTTAEEEE